MKNKILIIVFSIVLVACSVGVSNQFEHSEYKVLKADGNIEIRKYDRYIVAETYVEAGKNKRPHKAAQILSEYISGKNSTHETVATELPVTMIERKMNLWSMTVMLPQEKDLNSLPKPVSDKITIKEVEPRKVAAISFLGFWTESNFNEKTEELLEYLKKENYKISSQEINVFYNDQSLIPFFRRNEIMLEIQ